MPLDFTQALTLAGLTAEQALLYQALLQKGPQTAIGLARLTPIKRTYVYKLMEQLVEKGLVVPEVKPYGTKFAPASPDLLLDLVENQRTQINQANQALEQILPTLKNLYTTNEIKPVITYYEGVEGIKKIYRDTLATGQPIYAMMDLSPTDDTLREWLKTYSLERAEKKIPAKVILSSGKHVTEYMSRNPSRLREVRIVSRESFPFQHEINIYGDKVAIMHHQKDAPMLGIILHHHAIARSMQAWFELAWIGAATVSVQ